MPQFCGVTVRISDNKDMNVPPAPEPRHCVTGTAVGCPIAWRSSTVLFTGRSICHFTLSGPAARTTAWTAPSRA